MIGAVHGISVNKRFLVRFQDGCEKDLTSNQLTIVIVEKSLVDNEPEVPTNTEIPEEQDTLEKRYYNSVCVIIHFKKMLLLTGRMIRQTWKMILTRRIWKM